MIFTQSFHDDFTTLISAISPAYSGALAFARYADGEAAILFGGKHVAKSDGWSWRTGFKSDLPERLMASLQCSTHGWHVGVTAEEHHKADHHKLLAEVRVDLSFVTFAEIFIFANYQRFRGMNLDHCLVIGKDVRVPRTPDDPAWVKTIDELVPFMVQCGRPMLVSAGPWACVLIHEYWKRCPQNMRRVVLDVGSAINSGRQNRRYQHQGSPLQSWSPKWKL